MEKLRVGIVFGGKSAEHEVLCNRQKTLSMPLIKVASMLCCWALINKGNGTSAMPA
ncbi:hypothetical protein ACNKHM_05350 [Shigella sonnei]